jgi:hypothetical protein
MFNPEARWDRHLPADDVLPGEAVDVVAVFKKNGIIPRGFTLRGQTYRIQRIEFAWKERKGREMFHLFSVTDEQQRVHTLCVSRESLVWRILSEVS